MSAGALLVLRDAWSGNNHPSAGTYHALWGTGGDLYIPHLSLRDRTHARR